MECGLDDIVEVNTDVEKGGKDNGKKERHFKTGEQKQQ